ncbi:two-partner secretion domain-containing protein [Coleofasciculus sp. E1-EBD-02]|uniref:two-partner secretion domain-containing protein n=1 Tax=Coleofasciculus sp. E1-EBD-02 TaxID=3068481 RepID=UPI0032FBBEDE
MITLGWFTRRWQSLVIGSVAVVGMFSTGGNEGVFAQVIPDDTLGAEGSVVTPDIIREILSDRIDGGATRGANLFHSFIEFNVAEGRGVYFTNPDGIENILSRVTGDNVSTILGRLGVLGEANLFLLNPNGILFGLNASLDIEGSFLGTTANSFTFPDGSEFSATNPQAPPLLQISVPLGLQYGSNPGNVQVQGSNLQVNPGKTLALVGGNVSMDGGQLQASGGRIELGGVAGTGTVELSAHNTGNLLSLSFPDEVARADVSLTNQALVNVLAGGSGSIAVNAGNINMFAGSRLAAGIGQNSGSVGAVAGDITVEATGTVTLRESSLISNQVDPGGTGNSGNINLLADSLYLISGSQLFMSTFGQGNPGSLNVNVRDIVSVDSAGNNASTSGILNSFAGTGVGKGGDINITTGSLSMTNGAQLNSITFGEGDAGKVTINARDAVSIDGANVGASGILSAVAPNGIGNGGNINITTGSLSVTNGAQLNAITRGQGNAGNVIINARDMVSLDGQNQNNQAASAIFTAVGIGDDGTQAVGDGGDITITTESLSITGGAEVSALTRGQGNAGNVTINARDRVSLDGEKQSNGTPSQILTSVDSNEYSGYPNLGQAVGDGGDITITTGLFSATRGGSVSATTSGLGNAGNVTIDAREQVLIDGENSQGDASGIFSSVENNAYTDQPPARGDGGDINITTGAFSATRRGRVSATTRGLGNAGNVTIDARDRISFDELYSFAYSESGKVGNGGAISLIARDGDIIGNSSNSLLASFAVSEAGEAGSGGKVILEAQNNITNLEILTLSSSEQAGDVVINGLGDLSVTNTRILTSRRVDARVPVDFDPSTKKIVFETIIPDVGGQGQSGDVTITSSDNLTFNNSSIESDTNGSDRAGNVMITSPGRVTFNNSQIISTTSNIGNAGDIFINAGGGITFQGLYSYQDTPQRGGLFAGTTNQGFAGTITLTTPELTLENGANIATTTESSGKAGDITLQSHPNQENLTINLAPETSISASTNSPFTQATGGDIQIKAPDAITIQGEGTITTSTTKTGNAGTITLDTSTLTIARGAEIFAFTEGSGDSGTITVNATTAVNLGLGVDDFSPVLSVETRDTGKAGNIIVNTPSLTLSDTARITATATNTAMNPEGGGSISLNASTMNLAGIVGVFADTQGQTPAGTLTLKPYQNQSTLNLTLAPQSRISASTSGSGRGGNLEVSAPEAITIRGAGTLAVETTGEGAAGNLTIDTQRLTIADGATISASTASANPDGLGGNITINATESFTLNQAQLSAQSTGAAKAGNITINTGQLTATNSTIATSTEQSAGGAIAITAADIRLFGDSDITSRVASGAGGGGNITLTADSIIALDDSDILAFARDGKGGDITLTTPAFFGQNYQRAPKGTDPRTLDNNDRVDINATGAIEGVITITSDTGFIENSFIQLSGNGIDTDELIAESCIARRHEPQRGSFFITGTGGIPFRPGDVYDIPYQTGTVRSIPASGDGEESSSSTRRPWKMGDPIIEPTGIYRLANGKVIMSRLCGE